MEGSVWLSDSLLGGVVRQLLWARPWCKTRLLERVTHEVLRLTATLSRCGETLVSGA